MTGTIGCGDDAKEQGAGGSTSAQTSVDASSSGSGPSTADSSSSSSGTACVPGPTSDPWQSIGPYGGYASTVAAIGSSVLVATNFFVLRSGDGGQHWSSISIGGDSEVANFAKTSTALFVSTYSAIYRSTDEGITWTDVTGTLPTQFAGINMIQLDGRVGVSDPSSATNFFIWDETAQDWQDLQTPVGTDQIAATGNDVYAADAVGSLLYVSHSGAPFEVLTTPDKPVAVSAAGGNVVMFGGLNHPYTSTDGGASFTATSTENLGQFVVPTATGFIGPGNNGVVTSDDFGLSWHIETVPNLAEQSFTHATSTATTLFVAGNDGVFARPVANPAGWTMLPLGLYDTGPLAGDDTILLSEAANHVLVSHDAGSSWSEAPEKQSYSALKITSTGAFLGGSNSSVGIDRTVDDGATWLPSSEPPLPIIPAPYMACDGIVSTGTAHLAITGDPSNASPRLGAGIYRSTDDGVTWSLANQGLPVAGNDKNGLPYYAAMTAIAVGSGVVFVGSSDQGIFESTDDGLTWTASNTGFIAGSGGKFPTVLALTVSEHSVLASFRVTNPTTELNARLWRSTDQGATWSAVGTALPAGAQVGSLVSDGSITYAGVGLANQTPQSFDGVYVTHDDGTTWTALLDGMEGGQGKNLFLTPSRLYVGTDDRSFFAHALCSVGP